MWDLGRLSRRVAVKAIVATSSSRQAGSSTSKATRELAEICVLFFVPPAVQLEVADSWASVDNVAGEAAKRHCPRCSGTNVMGARGEYFGIHITIAITIPIPIPIPIQAII